LEKKEKDLADQQKKRAKTDCNYLGIKFLSLVKEGGVISSPPPEGGDLERHGEKTGRRAAQEDATPFAHPAGKGGFHRRELGAEVITRGEKVSLWHPVRGELAFF